MNGFFRLAVITAALQFLHAASRQVIYGKYYSLKTENGTETKFYGDNSYYIYLPPKNLILSKGETNPYTYTKSDESVRPMAPTVVHFYGCGWRNCGGPWTKSSSIVGDLNSKGIAVVSVGYRRVTTMYWYDDPQKHNARSLEELIHVDPDGRMTLSEGRTFKDYKPRVCRHEFITKSLYDGVQAITNLVSNSFVNGIDMNRLFFWAYSAGGSLAHYLTHVHHRWKVGSYTPLGMFYRSAMLDLPTANVLDRVWYDIQRSTRDTYRTKLKDLIAADDCWWVVGNGCKDPRFEKYLEPGLQYELCNQSWNERAVNRFCGPGFDHVTIGDLVMQQTWPRDDPEVGQGMEKIWYTSKNIQDHAPKPFHVLLYNLKVEDYGLLHSSLYVPAFKRTYHKAGIHYTAYYDDHPLMVDYPDTQGDIREVAMPDNHMAKYHSNHGWRDMLHEHGIKPRGDTAEAIRYACFVLKQPGCSPEPQALAPKRSLYIV